MPTFVERALMSLTGLPGALAAGEIVWIVMGVGKTIEARLRRELHPVHLQVLDETSMHNVPADSESHFRVLVVSPVFTGQRLVQRHRTVNDLLARELAGPVHALALEAFTPEEWLARGSAGAGSPPCLGGEGG